MADDLTFDPTMLKKKKKSKAVSFDALDETEAPSESPAPIAEEPSTTTETADDDFSGLKKKKKKKVLAFDLDEAAPATTDKLGNTETAQESAPVDEPAHDGIDDFGDLKKKKSKGKKKTAFDMEAFEKELAATEAPAGDGSDGEDGDGLGDADMDVPEGEDPFAAGQGDANKSKAELAADKMAWIKEDRDYTYPELLGRFYSLLFASHPSLSGGAKKRFTLAPPNVQREGSKRTQFANVADICKRLHRAPEHVIQFLFTELGTSGSVDGAGRLIIKGRFQQKQIEAVLRRYISEYVTCKTCKSPDTLLTKDNRIFFVNCESCGSKTSVTAIKSGFQAQVKKRKAMRTG